MVVKNNNFMVKFSYEVVEKTKRRRHREPIFERIFSFAWMIFLGGFEMFEKFDIVDLHNEWSLWC